MSNGKYTILQALGKSSHLVQATQTNKIFAMKSFKVGKNTDKKKLLKQLSIRTKNVHPNLLQMYDYFEEDGHIKILTELCVNKSLQDLMNTCVQKQMYLSEEWIFHVLYQLTFCLKTMEGLHNKLSLSTVFIDDKFAIKLYNFDGSKRNVQNMQQSMSDLGILIYEMCTLSKFDQQTYEKRLNDFTNDCYSNNLKSIIKFMIKDVTEIQTNLDKILCNPSVLLKSSAFIPENIFINNKPNNNDQLLESIDNTLTLEKLRRLQENLRFREKKLDEKEHKLKTREKKVSVLERLANEKLQQAELYLNRCRNASAKSETCKTSYENIDSTYAEFDDDATIIATSTKLNVDNIIKPANFSRTLSERRIRFKGHSPLKEINYNSKRRIQNQSKKISSNSEKRLSSYTYATLSSEKSVDSGIVKDKKILDGDNNIILESEGIRPISWNEENKKQAFAMLRMMNSNKENLVQHTFL